MSAVYVSGIILQPCAKRCVDPNPEESLTPTVKDDPDYVLSDTENLLDSPLPGVQDDGHPIVISESEEEQPLRKRQKMDSAVAPAKGKGKDLALSVAPKKPAVPRAPRKAPAKKKAAAGAEASAHVVSTFPMPPPPSPPVASSSGAALEPPAFISGASTTVKTPSQQFLLDNNNVSLAVLLVNIARQKIDLYDRRIRLLLDTKQRKLLWADNHPNASQEENPWTVLLLDNSLIIPDPVGVLDFDLSTAHEDLRAITGLSDCIFDPADLTV